jgi:Flp pilus assembly protein TadG
METTMRQRQPGNRPSNRIRDLLGRFRRDRDGATLVEFGLIAIPFFALLLAIIQTAMIYYVGEVLQTAVADSSRLIMTGQATSTNYDKTKFKIEICGRVPTLFDCQNLLQVDVQSSNSFPSSVPSPIVNGQLDSTSFGFDPGGPSQIVMVRAAMAYPVWLPIIGLGMANLDNNKRLIMSSAVFRNEPYGATP